MSNKISVITVVFNDVANIRNTMESFFSQTWEDKEYIVIDGGSTDGTVDIIKEYAHRLAYWCSEKDNGIYDAMNKGINHASGDWINILNSGDEYASPYVFENIFTKNDYSSTDIIYGDSIEKSDVAMRRIHASTNTSLLTKCPIFRHGSSLIRATVHKDNLYKTELKKQYGYSLDWLMLNDLYRQGCIFTKTDNIIEIYQKEGISNNQYQNLWYNYKITSRNSFAINKLVFFIKAVGHNALKNSFLYKWTKAFVLEYIPNDILPLIPIWNIRKPYLLAVGMKIGKGSLIMKNTYFINANLLTIGENTHINRDCILDARGHIEIGNSVSISHRVNIMTGSHDINSPTFMGIFKPIKIKDYAWIGVNATILQGVTIGKGAVVCAGAIVTKDVDDYSVVAGTPAKEIKKRVNSLNYKCKWNSPFA